jgi:DNA ligase-1
MDETPFARLAGLCRELERTKKRTELSRLLGEFLMELPSEEVPVAVHLVLGDIFPKADHRTLNISGSSFFEALSGLLVLTRDRVEDAFRRAADFGEAVRILLKEGGHRPEGGGLTISGVYRALEEIAGAAGPGSRARKLDLLRGLLARASPLEAKCLAKAVVGEMRHGVEEGMVLESLGRTLGIEGELLRRANMLTGDVVRVAGVAIARGAEGLGEESIRLFRPVKPMLAEMATDVAEVFGAMEAPFSLEYKIDGARIQAHCDAGKCRLYSRSLSDLTPVFPEVVRDVRSALALESAVLDGEVAALDRDGRPLPFQVLSRRLGRKRDLKRMIEELPVRVFFFDILYKDGSLLVDLPYAERWEALRRTGLSLVPRIIPRSLAQGEAFFRRAVDEGFEGLLAKALGSPYRPGMRGGLWLKVKKAVSLDLVITAAEWGYGRRRGWLSNYHLSARDEESGGLVMVGKTYKGLTDGEFQEMTRRLLALKRGERGGTVFVEPRVVVEVLFSDIQRSPRYRGGYALRFARIARLREDKTPREADTIQSIGKIYRGQLAPRPAEA